MKGYTDKQRKAMYAKKKEYFKEKGYKPNPNLTDSGNYHREPFVDAGAGSPFKHGGKWNKSQGHWQFEHTSIPDLHERYLMKFGDNSSIGGGFGTALKNGDLELAWSRADSTNQKRLQQLTGKTASQLEAMKDLAYSGQSFPPEKIARARKHINQKYTSHGTLIQNRSHP